MALNPLYIPLYNLQEALLDKTTGLQLAGGWVYCWEDLNRNQLKTVYELTGSPPNYTYTALSNPMVLSNAGTFVDSNGNDIVVYAYPYDAAGNPDNYYIQVFAAPPAPFPPFFPPPGTPIFTREAVPGVTATVGPNQTGPSSTENEIVNSQFVQTFFNPAIGMSIAYNAGTTTTPLAPGWSLITTASGSGTTTITRNSIAGSAAAATNPPYSLSVTPGANITQLILQQQLSNNPNIFASTNPNGTAWISAGIALAPNTNATVNILYAPQGASQTPTLLSATNPSGVWKFFNSTTQVNLGSNTATADTGFTGIQIQLPTTGTTTFSSIQIIGLASNVLNVPFNQQTVIQQQTGLAFYNVPLNAYKPVPSYLVGWDFPLNPAQLGTVFGTQALGINTAFATWDQTLVYQSITSGVSVARDTNGGFQMTSNGAGQVALIQYLDETVARKILSDRISVHISGSTTHAGGLAGHVTLWACTDANLPTAPLSVIATIDATGVPATNTGAWTQVPNLYQNTSFTLQAASTTNSESADISLNGWDLANAVPTNTAHYFAIVIGFAAWANLDTITINSVGLCAGDIATRPAPKSLGETLLDCQRYYWKTFIPGTTPTTNAGLNTGYLKWQTVSAAGSNIYQVNLPTAMRATPTIVLYNPVVANNNIRDFTTVSDATTNATANITSKTFQVDGTPIAGAVADTLGVHATADARLGIVN